MSRILLEKHIPSTQEIFYEKFKISPKDRVRISTIRAALGGPTEENKGCKFKKWLSKVLEKDIETIVVGGQSYVRGFTPKSDLVNQIQLDEAPDELDEFCEEELHIDNPRPIGVSFNPIYLSGNIATQIPIREGVEIEKVKPKKSIIDEEYEALRAGDFTFREINLDNEKDSDIMSKISKIHDKLEEISNKSRKETKYEEVIREKDDYINRLNDKIQQQHQLAEQEHRSSIIINTLKNRLEDCKTILRKKNVIIEPIMDINQKWELGTGPPVITPVIPRTY